VHYFSFALAYEDVLMCLRFEVLTAVKILMLVWVVMPCGLAGRYQNTIALIMEAVSTSEVLVRFYMVKYPGRLSSSQQFCNHASVLK
jgi:hypothetical protein